MRLDSRLSAIAELVRDNKRVADVGTDHAYLPLWLVRSGKCPYAIACDIREGPLANARKNVLAYGCRDMVDLRLCDGLSAVCGDEVDDVVIAGMGGDLISRIIAAADWLKDSKKRLVLQPMSSVEELRDYLCSAGFEIIREKVCIDGDKIYTVMLAWYNGEEFAADEMFRYIGKVDPYDEQGRRYILRQIDRLRAKAGGLKSSERYGDQADGILRLAEKIEILLTPSGR